METTATVNLTPAMMAQAFWGMSDTQQAEFFAELGRVIKADHQGGNTSAYSLGELQWHHLGGLLHGSTYQWWPWPEADRDLAREVLMSMAAPLYLHTLRATGGAA
jgi:hypothetical protein